jgi:hypothetical protein
MINDDDDKPIWGAEKIAEAIDLVDEDGKPAKAKALYHLNRGQIPASKMGRLWVTTRGRLKGLVSTQFLKNSA